MLKRRKTIQVRIGHLFIGSEHPPAVQSMLKGDPEDIAALVAEARDLEDKGCEIIRMAVKNKQHLNAVARLKKEVRMPVVTDIHFDHKLAVEAVEAGADKVRINPGNIYKTEELKDILVACKERDVPIRIGVNSGSLRKHFDKAERLAEEMAEEALKQARFFQDNGFDQLVVSLKAPEVRTTMLANRIVAEKTDLPLHVGLTATGEPEKGIIKSSIGIGALLAEGVGDTIRVSLTSDAAQEIRVARDILQATGLRRFGFELISCPTCGRANADIVDMVEKASVLFKTLAKEHPEKVNKFPKIAIMGCEVNGPGEAKAADAGVAFGREKASLFKKGRVIKTVKRQDALEQLVKLIKEN